MYFKVLVAKQTTTENISREVVVTKYQFKLLLVSQNWIIVAKVFLS